MQGCQKIFYLIILRENKHNIFILDIMEQDTFIFPGKTGILASYIL